MKITTEMKTMRTMTWSMTTGSIVVEDKIRALVG